MASVLTTRANLKLQDELQATQAQLSNGLLSQKGQQIASNILTEMARASLTNTPIRQILTKHGYNVEPVAAPVEPREEVPTSEGSENE